MTKTIITVALTGAGGNKKNNPATPITVEEIAADAIKCYQAGAAIVHLHMKDDAGIFPSMEVAKFKRTRELIEAETDLIVNMTTSGEYGPKIGETNTIGHPTEQKHPRMGVLELKPEIGTYDIPTLNFGDDIFFNPNKFLREMGSKMIEIGTKPELEIFDYGDIEAAKKLIKSGHIQTPAHFQFVLGIAGGAPATVENLAHMVRLLPAGSTWGAFGIGRDHLPIIYATLALGGHVRVGLEDNLYFSHGVLATNESLTKRAVEITKLFGNEVATPNEAREILGLKPRQK